MHSSRAKEISNAFSVLFYETSNFLWFSISLFSYKTFTQTYFTDKDGEAEEQAHDGGDMVVRVQAVLSEFSRRQRRQLRLAAQEEPLPHAEIKQQSSRLQVVESFVLVFNF